MPRRTQARARRSRHEQIVWTTRESVCLRAACVTRGLSSLALFVTSRIFYCVCWVSTFVECFALSRLAALHAWYFTLMIERFLHGFLNQVHFSFILIPNSSFLILAICHLPRSTQSSLLFATAWQLLSSRNIESSALITVTISIPSQWVC